MISNILIADDHALVREGLKKVLSPFQDFNVAAEAKNSNEIFETLRKHKIDILLLDVSMPGRSGLDIIKDIKNQFPGVKILVLSMHPEDRFATRALKLGASGYLTKETAPEELVRAIRKILSGKNYISASMAETLAEQLKSDSKNPPHETLSNREFEVFRHIASGKTISEIASEMCLSVATVSTYRSRILQKMNMKSNAELIYYGITNNLTN